tara:strand:- start:127 stop:693 length:567 start_codon:yes stop_codon:yes gene_type:complete
MPTLLELQQRQRRRFSNFDKRIEKNKMTYVKPQPINKPNSQIVRQMQRDVLRRQKENRNKKALQEIKRKENSKQMKKQNILKNREMYNWLQEYEEQTKKEREENMEKERRRTIIYNDDWSQEEIIEKAREELQRRMETQKRQPNIITPKPKPPAKTTSLDPFKIFFPTYKESSIPSKDVQWKILPLKY